MKKILVVFAALFVLVGCGSKSETKQELRVFNWGSYIDEKLISEFEKKFNAKVTYEMFDSNEAMYLKLVSDPYYDILVPTDYMVERLRTEGRLQKLDYTKIPNYSDVMSHVKGRALDPENEYTAPYFWGNVGIVYDHNQVALADLENDGWSIFKNPTYAGKTYVLDSERDTFMMALKSLGYSMNTTSESELQEAYNWLVEMDKATKPIYVRDEIIDSIISGVKPMATMYSGDATYALSQNENLSFYVPQEGTNAWMDAMVIPKDARNVDLAHEWINFVLSADSQQRITEEIGYTSPRQDVIDIVTTGEGAFAGIESYETRTNYPKDENYRFDDVTRVTMSELWQRVKTHE